jgi:hypothetical protein
MRFKNEWNLTWECYLVPSATSFIPKVSLMLVGWLLAKQRCPLVLLMSLLE